MPVIKKSKQELKQEIWKKVKQDIINEIGDKYEIMVEDLDKDSDYFHPIVVIPNLGKLRSQCDTDITATELNEKTYYALSFIPDNYDVFYPLESFDIKFKHGIDHKKAITKLQNGRISQSIEDTLSELLILKDNIKSLKNSIKSTEDLIESKIKLLNEKTY